MDRSTTRLRPPFYIVSDTHFYHKNIIKYCGRPHDHEAMMLKRWQKAVKERDVVLHLGDLFFGGEEGYERFKNEITPRLPGKKYIILGNHDKRKYDYRALGFTPIKPFVFKYRGYTVSLSHFPTLLDEGQKLIHLHGHIHNHPYSLDEIARWGNINCSVELLNYRPHRVTRLLNREIRRRNQQRRYYNSKGFRTSWTRNVQRRTA